jgi:glycosyltransferase involved in cell wall biosynthesis
MPIGRESPAVSVVVICHNYGQFLGECLESILRQPARWPTEVIVVDDGSTDETPVVAARFAGAGVKVLRHATNRGLTAALNTGLEAASGEYVARIDADDRYRPCFFEETIPVLEQRPQVGLVYGDAGCCDGAGRLLEDPYSGLPTRARHDGRDWEGDELLAQLVDYVVPCPTILMRGSALRAVLPIPSWFEWEAPTDWYLTTQIARRFRTAYRARTLADYRVHGANMHRRPGATDGREERTVLRTIDDIFTVPGDRVIAADVRRRVYATTYEREGNRYFGNACWADARRCYWEALRRRPANVLRPEFARHLAATFAPAVYTRLKSVRRGAVPPPEPRVDDFA